MRLITTLSLGVAALACAAPLYAQPAVAPFTAAPAATRTTPPAAPAPAAPAAAPASPAPPTVTAAATPPAVNSSRIAATVNDTSISDYEVEQRLAFFVAVSGAKPTPEELARRRLELLDRLEEEKIQIAEARKRRISVSPVEIDERVNDFLKESNSTMERLNAALTGAGTSIKTLRDQYQASIAWTKVLQSEFSSEIIVTQAMIDDALRRAVEGANKPRYKVAEIFLAVDRPEDDARIKTQMEDIEKQIRNGGSFRTLARQWSRNPSAALGGDMGWVYDGQLEVELNKTVAGLQVGELSHPVRGQGGWYLLGLSERLEPVGTNVTVEAPAPSGPPGTLPLARLLLPLPPGAPKEAQDNTMRVAMQVRSLAESCEALEKISQDKALIGSVFANLGNFKLTDLNPALQKALADTKSGEAALPVMLDAGVEIFVRCDKRAPPPRAVFKPPTRDEIENQLFQEQIASLARRFMRDLRRKISIERQRDNAVVDAALVK